jgi:hypothetical protein
MTTFMSSALPTWPIVARQSMGTRRISPLGKLISDANPLRGPSGRAVPALRQKACTAAREHLDIVNLRRLASAHRQAIAHGGRSIGAVFHHLLADLQTVGGDDVRFSPSTADRATRALRFGSYWMELTCSRHAVFKADEVDDPVLLLVATATVTDDPPWLLRPPFFTRRSSDFSGFAPLVSS